MILLDLEPNMNKNVCRNRSFKLIRYENFTGKHYLTKILTVRKRAGPPCIKVFVAVFRVVTDNSTAFTADGRNVSQFVAEGRQAS